MCDRTLPADGDNLPPLAPRAAPYRLRRPQAASVNRVSRGALARAEARARR